MYRIIKALEETPGRNDKEAIVEQAWHDGNFRFFDGAKLAYDALMTFGIKKVPQYDLDGSENLSDLFQNDGFDWNGFLEITDRLYKRDLTGNESQAVIKNAASK